jgi:hypothetical protein
MALIKGREVKEDEGQEYPANPRLWNMVTTQAKSRFSKNSPASAHWVRTHYTQMGGKFVSSKKEIDPRNRDIAEEKKEQKEKQDKKRIVKDVKKKVTRPVTKSKQLP